MSSASVPPHDDPPPRWVSGLLPAVIAVAAVGGSVGADPGLARAVAWGAGTAALGLWWWLHRRQRELERRLAEAETELAEHRGVRRALDLHSIVVVTDRAGRILEANDRFCELSGYARAELIGRTHKVVNSGVHPKEFFRGMWQTILAGRPWRGEIVNRRKSGELYYLDSVFVPVPGPDGQPERFVGLRHDLTALRHAVADRERLALVARSASAAMWTMDPGYRIEWVNPAFEQLTGFLAPEAVGRRPGELLHGPETAEETVAAIDRDLLAERAFETEVLHYRKDGRAYWGHTRVAPVFDAAGRLTRWVAVEQDITEIRRRNALHAAVLANAAYGMIATDEAGTITVFNRGAELMTGYGADEVVRRASPMLLHDPDEIAARAAELAIEFGEAVAVGFEAFVARTRRTGRSDEHDWTYIRKDGGRFTVRIAVSAMRDPAGRLTGWLGVVSDVTPQRQALAALQASEARLREAQQVARIGGWELRVAAGEIHWSEEAALLVETWPHLRAPLARTFAMYAAEDRPRVEAAWREAAERGAPISYEASLRTLGGRELRVRVAARAEKRDDRVTRVFGTMQDISELYAAEAAQRELARRLEKISAQLPGVVYQFKIRADGSSCLPYASAALREVFDVGHDEVREDARVMFDRIHPDDLARVTDHILRTARTLEPWVCEFRIRRRDGSVRWHLGMSQPERTADGGTVWHGYISDITARKETEETQRRSEERYALIAAATNDAVWDYDAVTGGIWWSDGITRLFGWPKPEPAGGVAWWAARIAPEDAARVTASFATALEGAADRWEEEYRFRHADGRWLTVLDRGSILRDAAGRAVRALGGMMDVTQRHEAEVLSRQLSERLRLATAVAHIGVWDADVASNSQLWDQETYLQFGLDPERDPADGTSWTRVAHPDDRARVEAAWREAVETGDRLDVEYRIVRPDGTRRILHALATVQRDAAGRALRLVGVNWDVTAERESAAAVLAAKEQAEAAARAKSEFLANMSHEIRTPLNAVIGMGGLLLETPLSREQREFAETIRRSGDTLLTLINDILDFSKIESGSLELERQPFNLRDCVESALDLFGAAAAEKKLELLYWIDPAVPLALEGDVTRLRQIVVNLVSNAVKFTAAGEVFVTVEPAAEPASGADFVRLQLAVRDTGVGIPADRMDRLFKSFSQVDASTTRRYGGTGLGLAISKRLCELMGGRISVESTEGGGTTFRVEVELPRWREEALPAKPTVGAGWSGRRVLVVEDNASQRDVLRRQLEAWGVEAVVAADAPAADAWLARDLACDAVLLDAGLPGLDLRATIRAWRERPALRALPVVVFVPLGVHTGPEPGEGIVAQLSKPVRISALGDTLAEVFDRGPRPAAPAPTRGAAKLGEHQPLTLLLVEDNVTNQRVAQLLLTRLGYRADVATNGLECLEALARQTYDVVLMDIQMPEMDGLTAAREIGRRFDASRRPYVVAMTANAMQGDREDCLAAGMQDYVAKPVQLRDLEAALRRAYGECRGASIG